MLPWKTVESVKSSDGHVIELRQRGTKDFLIMDDGRVLMTSSEKTSELAVASLACEALAEVKAPRILIGGLGMAYTVRAALDALPRGAKVQVAELTPQVVTWCKGPLAHLTKGAALDPRVTITVGDVSRVIANARPEQWDAVILDLYEGPHGTQRRENDPFYGRMAIERTNRALTEGGIFSVWSEEGNGGFKRRMVEGGFETRTVHPGGPSAYVVYLGKKSKAVDLAAHPMSRQGQRARKDLPAKPKSNKWQPAGPSKSAWKPAKKR